MLCTVVSEMLCICHAYIDITVVLPWSNKINWSGCRLFVSQLGFEKSYTVLLTRLHNTPTKVNSPWWNWGRLKERPDQEYPQPTRVYAVTDACWLSESTYVRIVASERQCIFHLLLCIFQHSGIAKSYKHYVCICVSKTILLQTYNIHTSMTREISN